MTMAIDRAGGLMPPLKRAELTSKYDDCRHSVTYRVTIPGVSKYLLFNQETLEDLRSQIDRALRGPNRVRAT